MTTQEKVLRTKHGVVVSDKMDKTVTVLIDAKKSTQFMGNILNVQLRSMLMMRIIVLKWETM